MKHSPVILVLAALLPFVGLPALGCAGSAEPSAEPRYPEKRRPPPLRSASDGEILGADGVAPEDRLEASPTNEHPAKGWVVEDGKLMPEKEVQHRHEAHRRAGYTDDAKEGSKTEPDCEPAPAPAGAAPVTTTGTPGDGRKRKPCPPPQRP